MTGELKGNPMPANSSIKPYVDIYREAVREPSVQAWFASKGLDLSTVRIFDDSVVGVVIRDGVEMTQTFTTTDGSGWWEVSAKVRAAQKTLSPGDIGILLPDATTGDFVHVDVILDFYGVTGPDDRNQAVEFGNHLKENGWPAISDQKRSVWSQQFSQLLQKSRDLDGRSRLVTQLQALVDGKGEGDTLDLAVQHTIIDPASSLAQKSLQPREHLGEFLGRPAFKAFIEKMGFGTGENIYRISGGNLEIRDARNQWMSLQADFDDEVIKVSGDGSAQQSADVILLNAELNQLVEMSKTTGGALYSSALYDIRQALEFSGLGSPDTVETVQFAIGWLSNQLPPSPLAADYAGLTPYAWVPGALSRSDFALLSTNANGPGSVSDLLRSYCAGEELPTDPDLKLQVFFDSPQALAKAQELAESLNMAEVVDGHPLSRATRHQLLAAVLKASVTTEMPGKPGVVAGYEIYQPNNLGRSMDEVRQDVESHLRNNKGLDATTASLIAHMLLAQAAPEFLIKPDPFVPANAPPILRLSPGQVSVGSTAWLNLRLGCAMAEKLGGAGSSRSLNITQTQALIRPSAMGPEQDQLIKSLGVQPLLDWAVMAGLFPKTSDGRYSPGDYQAASVAFADRENRTQEAFQALTREPPTQTSLLVQQLAELFPELTEEEIRTFKLELDTEEPYDARQHGHLETRRPLLTDVILTEQTRADPLVALNQLVNALLSGVKKYKFVHPLISQETFNERIKELPQIAPLVAPAVDRYIADNRRAHETVIRLMIANSPLEVRRALEVGKIEFFTLREETGQTLEEELGEGSKLEEKKGKHGLLMRYESGAAHPRFGYFEVFPASMKMIKRDDLSYRLALGGEVQAGKSPYGPFAYVDRDFRKAKPEKFDFQAYDTGTEPRPGAESNVIIEKSGEPLPGPILSQWPGPASVYVPNSWASSKTRNIAEAVLGNTFDGKREKLMAYANQPTNLQKRRSYPFDSGEVLTMENLRAVISLIPFVGAIADISEGKIAAGFKGLLIDFASYAGTGGLGTARSFFRGFKTIVPFSSRAFTMQELTGGARFFRSLFNPLDGVIDVLKSGSKFKNAVKTALEGKLVPIGSGMFIPSTAFEKCRWGLGMYETLAPNAAGQAGNSYPGSQLGFSQNCALYAVQKDARWYAIDPITREPTGSPLEDFQSDSVPQ